jgi:hypothetical protein
MLQHFTVTRTFCKLCVALRPAPARPIPHFMMINHRTVANDAFGRLISQPLHISDTYQPLRVWSQSLRYIELTMYKTP